jgi:hypothetical protein
MADTEDLKSSGSQGPCGFESRPRHLSASQHRSDRFLWRLVYQALPLPLLT